MLTDGERQRLSGFVAQGPPALFATVSGAHLYGFASADSDYDLRGAMVMPLRQVLSLREHRETLEVLEERDGIELDWVAHDVRKFARMMTRRNGYVLEQLFSPLVVVTGDWHAELKAIGRGCVVRHVYHHYRGFLRNQRRLLDRGDHTVKRLLYCYRVVLTGLHVLATGELECNLPTLAERYKEAAVPDLVARKRDGAEKGALAPGEADAHRSTLDRLELRLEEAFAASTLPEVPTTFAALDDFVVRACLELGR